MNEASAVISSRQASRLTTSRRDPGRCPACGAAALDVFFEQTGVPVTSNASFRTREEALACGRGAIRLAFCPDCGLIANVAFEDQPLADERGTTQAASPRSQDEATTHAPG